MVAGSDSISIRLSYGALRNDYLSLQGISISSLRMQSVGIPVAMPAGP